MRILICGDRNYKNRYRIESYIEGLPKDTVIINGGAKGADTIAKNAAKERGLKTRTFKANWKKHGKSAGPIRNKRMLKEGRPELVVAFHDNMKQSKGTKNMLLQAEESGVVTKLFTKGRTVVHEPTPTMYAEKNELIGYLTLMHTPLPVYQGERGGWYIWVKDKSGRRMKRNLDFEEKRRVRVEGVWRVPPSSADKRIGLHARGLTQREKKYTKKHHGKKHRSHRRTIYRS